MLCMGLAMAEMQMGAYIKGWAMGHVGQWAVGVLLSNAVQRGLVCCRSTPEGHRTKKGMVGQWRAVLIQRPASVAYRRDHAQQWARHTAGQCTKQGIAYPKAGMRMGWPMGRGNPLPKGSAWGNIPPMHAHLQADPTGNRQGTDTKATMWPKLLHMPHLLASPMHTLPSQVLGHWGQS